MKKISMFFSKYKNLSKKINEETSFIETIKSTVLSILVSVLVTIIPILIIYNLYLFYNIRVILNILIILVIFIFSFIFNKTYHFLIKNKNLEIKTINTNIVIYVDTVIAASILTIFALIVMQLF